MPSVPAGTDRFARSGSVPGDAQIESLRLPPHSVEAEQAVLGGLLLSNAAWDRIGDVINESDFYRADHRTLWRAIIRLIDDNKPADVLTVAETLKVSGELQDVGGLSYLHQLASGTPSAANIRRYAEIVRERAIMRKLAEVGTTIADSAYSPQGREARQLLDEAETKILEIGESGGRSSESFAKMSSVLAEVMSRLDELHRNPNSVTGKATGYVDLDEMTTGLQDGDLIIIAGRPSMGKTALALNIAEHVGLELKLPVLVFSMEMGGTQLATRLLGSVGKVDAQKLRTGRLDPQDWDRLGLALGKLNEAPILIDETPALNPLELRARARRKWREYGGLGLVVVDYIQLMQGTDQGAGENRATELSEISRGLKAMAKELSVPVIALSQLNRSLEQRPNKRPVMSDLRECVSGETLVLLADGRRIPIRELVGTKPQVIALFDDGRLRVAASDCVWSAGVKPLVRVTLACGRSIRATRQHRLYGPEGWLAVGDLRIGARLAVAQRLPDGAAGGDWTALPDVRALLRRVAAGVPVGRTLEPTPAIAEAGGDSLPLEALFEARAPALRAFGGAGDEPLAAPGSDIFWDRVVAIEPDGEEEVFDLTVPGPACWLADGIVSHNSGALEQDADMIFFIYRDEVYNEDSPDKGIAEIIIGKQRNGPIGTVKLTFLGKHTRFENFSGAPGY